MKLRRCKHRFPLSHSVQNCSTKTGTEELRGLLVISSLPSAYTEPFAKLKV